MIYYIKADNFLLENGEKRNGYLQVENGLFGDFVQKIPEGAKVLDWTGFTIAPGLFDTHIHGVKGYDVMDDTVEAIQEISNTLLSLGVTRFLPTTLTSHNDDLEQAIIAVREAVEEGLPGAESEGIFLEGPYFTEKHKGAQNPMFFRAPDLDEYYKW